MLETGKIEAPVLILVGPTAIGKTELSLRLGQEFSCEIVSVDSMQVYRYMDIGTAKASLEERGVLPHHLIDIADPDETYDAVKFCKDAGLAISGIHARKKIPLLTGGTGLYIKALLQGIFPGVPESKELRSALYEKLHNQGTDKLHEELTACDYFSAKRIHKNDTQRIVRALEVYYATGKPMSAHLAEHKANTQKSAFTNALQLGLTTDRQILYKRIDHRCLSMVESGLEAEVEKLLGMGYSEDLNSMKSIGYRHMVNYLNGVWSKEKMLEILRRDTRRYAKRQYTWFSKNREIRWFSVEDRSGIVNAVSSWLDRQ